MSCPPENIETEPSDPELFGRGKVSARASETNGTRGVKRHELTVPRSDCRRSVQTPTASVCASTSVCASCRDATRRNLSAHRIGACALAGGPVSCTMKHPRDRARPRASFMSSVPSPPPRRSLAMRTLSIVTAPTLRRQPIAPAEHTCVGQLTRMGRETMGFRRSAGPSEPAGPRGVVGTYVTISPKAMLAARVLELPVRTRG